jgi:ubiquinone/menaquinone biosynthesis C-methylase UbiE
MRNDREPTADPTLHVLELAGGFLISQAVFLAVRLGLPDRLADGPETAAALAEVTGTHPLALGRVLRTLAHAGILSVDARADGEARFANTAAGGRVCAAPPDSVRSYVLMLAEDWMWQCAPDLRRVIATGQPAFDRRYGMPVYAYFEAHPETARAFDDSMTAYSRMNADEVARAYPLTRGARIVDLGGGHGYQIEAFLLANPGTRGVIFDQAHVIEAARPRVERTAVADRCELVAGDFFQSVPAGADFYVMRSVIHNWKDEQAISILKNCRAAMVQGGKVLMVEVVISSERSSRFGELLDLQMQLFTSGRERTAEEHRRLYEQAGLRMTRIVPTTSFMQVVEGVAA